MADVLTVATAELGDPLAVVVAPVSDDGTVHEASVPVGPDRARGPCWDRPLCQLVRVRVFSRTFG